MSDSITNKGMKFALFLIFMAVIGGMTILGTDGSVIVYAVIHSLVDWAELIGLGLALALIGIFSASRKKKGSLF